MPQCIQEYAGSIPFRSERAQYLQTYELGYNLEHSVPGILPGPGDTKLYKLLRSYSVGRVRYTDCKFINSIRIHLRL